MNYMNYFTKAVAWINVLVDTFVKRVPYAFYVALLAPYVLWLLQVGGFLFVLAAVFQAWTMIRLNKD